MISNKNKVLVIGLDGADFKIIQPLIKKGKLQNLSKFLRQGAYGKLATVIPPVSPSAWTSFSTGKLPSKHGIFDFFYHKQNPFQKKVATNSTSIKSKTVWELLTEAKKSSIIIDVPLQYPPIPINGIMISRFFAESLTKAFYPRGLYRHLMRKKFPLSDDTGFLAKSNQVQDKKKVFESIENKISLVKYLNKTKRWDLFVVVFQDIDMVCHRDWGKFQEIEAVYEKLDWAVGEIFKLAGGDVIKFIISDHGFCKIEGNLCINEVLCQLGYLPRAISRKALEHLLKTGKMSKDMFSGGKKFELKINYRYDYLRSQAYCSSGLVYGIYINLIGRNKKGQVSLNNYNRICRRIIRELSQVRAPHTKERLFGKVWQNNLASKHASKIKDLSPDIFFVPYKMKYNILARGNIYKIGEYVRKVDYPLGFHDLYGIFIALGKDIKNGEINNPSLIDLAPTILHILGVPIPYDLDGRILSNIFVKSSYFSKSQPKYQGSSAVVRRAYRADSKAQERIFRQLKKLGYIR